MTVWLCGQFEKPFVTHEGIPGILCFTSRTRSDVVAEEIDVVFAFLFAAQGAFLDVCSTTPEYLKSSQSSSLAWCADWGTQSSRYRNQRHSADITGPIRFLSPCSCLPACLPACLCGRCCICSCSLWRVLWSVVHFRSGKNVNPSTVVFWY